tara:strand:+ start:296 stop:925 length:630 start_codon:yes stop_codon:yes gene_type:complete
MIILATHNSGKIKEFKRNLSNRMKNFKVVDLKYFGISQIAEESGTTFEENAKQKLHYYFELLNKKGELKKNILISEDSGLEILALDGKPGVKSARYGGERLSDNERNEYLLNEMQNIPENQRDAKFVCVVAIAGSSIKINKPKIFKSELSGSISLKKEGSNGFGYDPIFINSTFNKTNAQLKDFEKDKISHRGQTIKKIIPLLEEINIF